jgi:hypothetical protein
MAPVYDDDDPFDANGLLKDGRTVRISMQARDSVLGDQRRRKVRRYDPAGREESWEEETDDSRAPLHDARAGAGFLHDGHGHKAGHRPGYLMRADIANEQRRQAHDAYRFDLENAWRNPAVPARPPAGTSRRDAEGKPPTGFGSHGSRGEREGDLCTCRGPEFPESFGAPGTLQMRGGELVCVPDAEYRRSTEQPDPASDRRSVADEYARYDQRISQAWRNPE